MALKTGYLSYKDDYPEPDEDKWVITTRGHHNELGPSKNLLQDYKNGEIDWERYKERFLKEMDNPASRESVIKLVELSKEKDIRLICYERPEKHCHRHIIASIVKQIGGKVPDRKEREQLGGKVYES